MEETRPRAEDASRVPRQADPVAECDLAEVFATGFDLPANLDRCSCLSVAPATPITIIVTIVPAVAVPIVGPVVAIVIAIAVIVTAIMSPGVSVVVGNLLDLRVRDSGTIQRECGYGVGRAGTRK